MHACKKMYVNDCSEKNKINKHKLCKEEKKKKTINACSFLSHCFEFSATSLFRDLEVSCRGHLTLIINIHVLRLEGKVIRLY